MPAARAIVKGGWLNLPYDGHDVAQVEIGVGEPTTWYPAFLDFLDGQRVAKIRPPEGMTGSFVKLRVNGAETMSARYMG